MKNQTKNTQLYSGSILSQFDTMVHCKRSRGSNEFWLLVTTSAVFGRICKLASVLSPAKMWKTKMCPAKMWKTKLVLCHGR